MKGLFCFWADLLNHLVSYAVMKNSIQPFAHINIPKPCGEDWTGMDVTDQGRFCMQCSKSVIDFSRFTDQQLYDYFEQHHTSSICGRIPISKLNKTFAIPSSKKRFTGWWLLSALAGISLPVFSHTPTERFVQMVQIHQSISMAESISDTSYVHVKGIIFDKNSRERLPFVNIQLQRYSIQCMSNVDGEFDLKFPDSIVSNGSVDIQISYVGFETLITNVPIVQPISGQIPALTIELELRQSTIIGMVIYERPPWHRRLKYRMKRIFKTKS